ncbi:hypothetical protein F511_06543 [Dorcoceras hygrometricum]|uniref:Dystroglycan-like n=1 Tax=Dorcoceras hygrometricum TaxID=472368 RepID=A0A2Z7CCY1_9LAMI|nr:hypothetical protein F511_06543 [Dorcoceras hygrometricum]
MASSLISRSHHIDFDSVFRFDDAEMVQMFESLITTGLKEFLGCPAIFYENALTEFFSNGSVRDGLIVSTIDGIAVEISESVFAAMFALPTEGLTDLSEVPRNFISDAQSLFSVSEKEVSISCLKKEMKMQYRLLSDILAKSLFVKAGSFDAVTRDRFLLMTEITFDVKFNWGSLLFGVLKEMVTPDSRQAKGYAIQICVLLKNIPGLELGESKTFPAPRILNEKTVHRIVSVNENVGVEEVAEAPRAKKTPVKKIVSKKRPAARDAESKELRLGANTSRRSCNWGAYTSRRSCDCGANTSHRIRFGQGIEFRDVDAYTPNLPRIDISDKGKGILVEDDIQGHPARETFSLICADIEFLIALREKVIEDVSIFEVNSFALEPVAPTDDQEELLYSVEVPHSPSPVVQVPESPSSSSDSDIRFDSVDIHLDSAADTQTSLPTASVDLSSLLDVLQASLCQQGARQEGQTQDDIQFFCLNELRKSVMAHDVKAGTDSLDVRNKLNALDAKVLLLDGQIAAMRNDQLEFQTKIAADILGLSTQISEIADYIRSGDGKKGEVGSSSRRPLPASQPSSHVQGSAVRTQTFPPTTGTFAERVEQARRHIIESGQVISTEEAAERVIEADRQESDRLERERARERRERRLSRSGAYKRRRG